MEILKARLNQTKEKIKRSFLMYNANKEKGLFMHNTAVSFSNGWLLLSNDRTIHYSLWNPETTDCIALPPLKSKAQRFVDHLLSSSPAELDCLVLLFSKKSPSITYCRPGDEQWSEFDYGRSHKENPSVTCGLHSPTSCRGKIYALSLSNFDLLMINVDESYTLSLSFLGGPELYHLRSKYVWQFLVESGEELYSINFIDDVDEKKRLREPLIIELDKFDFSVNAWKKVTTGNSRAIFLNWGGHYNFSWPAAGGSSFIYFGNLDDWSSLYKYRIEDESLTPYLAQQLRFPAPWSVPDNWVDDDRQQDINAYLEEQGEENSEEVGRKGDNIKSKKGDEKERNLFDRPPEIHLLIEGRLSCVDSWSFRCVNTICTPTIDQQKTGFFSPCFLFSERDKGVFNLVDSRLNGKHTVTIPKILDYHTIRYSKNGWLLVDRERAIAFFNPFTGDVIQFPGLLCDPYSIFIFTSLPSSPECSVISLKCYGREMQLGILRLGRELRWNVIRSWGNDPSFHLSHNSPVFYRGSFYYLGKDGRLGVLTLKNDGSTASWEVIAKPQSADFHQIYLTECNRELLSISVGPMGKKVHIFILNHSRQDWEEIRTLGSYSLYISRSSSVSIIAERPDMANRIYFPRFYQERLVYYSLDTGKYHYLGCKNSLRNYYGTSVPLDCAWVEVRSSEHCLQG